MPKPWFKFYGQEYLNDLKMVSCTASERSCWVTLLAYASVANVPGVVCNMDEVTLMLQGGVSELHEEWEATKGVLTKFEKLGMIEITDGNISIVNWNKRQESYMTGAERVAKHRLLKRNKVVTPVTRVYKKVTLEIDKEGDVTSVSNDTLPEEIFSLPKAIKALEDSDRRDMNIIALYFTERKPEFETKEQYQVAVRRHLRAAKSLTPFSDPQILKAVKKAKADYPEWTIETLVKLVTK